MLAVALLVSCEKLLEVDLPENQIPSEVVFDNVQTANAALSGLYARLWDKSPLAGDQGGKLLGLYTDDLTFYAVNSTNGLPELSNNTLLDTNMAVDDFWNATYQQIYLSNAILEGLEHSRSISLEDVTRMRGEVLVIRSVLYFYLQQLFGDIPLVLSTSYTQNQSLSKTASESVLEKIEHDLLIATELLEDDYRHIDRIFINRKTAQMLMAKIQMQQKRWPEAELTLKKIVNSPLYQFQNDLSKVFTKSGTHIIWQLKPKNNGDAVKEASIYYFVNAAPASMSLSDDLVNSFASNDLRRNYYLATVKVGNNTWYRAEKYKNRTSNTTENSIVFRLEEVYLLLAESLTKQNKVSEALQYINPIRKRAGQMMYDSGISPSDLLTKILQENRREFFTEMGHRFIDLKRFGRLDDLHLTKPNWKPYHAYWPIPQKELLLNSNLNPQNTGY